MKKNIQFRLNGRPTKINTDDDRRLLWVLRTDLDLTGTKHGCGAGLCGSCTVVVDGKAVRSCQTPLKNVDGKEVVTIEGLAQNDKLHPLQQAFVDHGALQCGFCTSGMLMTLTSSSPAMPIRPRRRCARRSPATCAAVPAISRSSPPPCRRRG